MATDLLEKVRRLIALTASDNVNEARTAAFQACKLIRENKLELRRAQFDAAPSPGDYSNDFRRASRASTYGGVSRIWEDLFRTTEVPYPHRQPDPTPRRKFFCDGCKTECPATWQRGTQKMCERCRDDFDRVMKEDEERRRKEAERHKVYDFGPTIDFDMGSGTFSNTPSQQRIDFDEANRLRAMMGFGPLTEEEFARSFYR